MIWSSGFGKRHGVFDWINRQILTLRKNTYDGAFLMGVKGLVKGPLCTSQCQFATVRIQPDILPAKEDVTISGLSKRVWK